MAAPRKDLDTGYYLQHFNELLQFVGTHYAQCLTTAEQQWLLDFAALTVAPTFADYLHSFAWLRDLAAVPPPG